MYAAVVVLALATVASGNAIAGLYGSINQPITVELANQLKGIFDRFQDCVTPPVAELASKLTKDDIQALVDLQNKVVAGEITMPSTRAEGLEVLKQYTPSIYDDLVAINADFEKRIATLSGTPLAKINDLESGYFNVLKTRTQEDFVNYNIGICHEYAALSPADHDSLKAAFPETVKCLDEDLFKQICAAVDQLKADNYKMSSKTFGLIGAIFKNKRFDKIDL